MPYYNKDPKRDHNFDNHPCNNVRVLSRIPERVLNVQGFGDGGFGGVALGTAGVMSALMLLLLQILGSSWDLLKQ